MILAPRAVGISNRFLSHTRLLVQVYGPGPGSSVPGVSVSVTVFGVDSAGHALSYSATNLPSGLSIDSTTGVISGTISSSAVSTTPYSVTITATDSAADVSASTTFNWTVTSVSLTKPGMQSNLVGDTVDLALSATDALGNAMTFSASGLPAGLSINSSTGAITGSPTTAGAYMVAATATDSVNGTSASQSFVWIVNQITLQNPGNQYSAAGASISLALTANAPAGDTVTYSATGLPPGLTINSSTGTISGTISSGTVGDFLVTLTATDTTAGASAGGSIWWVVSSGITLQNPGFQSNSAGATVNLALTVSAPAGDSVALAATGLPPGLSINASTGAITGTITSGTSGIYSVKITADDTTAGAMARQFFSWLVPTADSGGGGAQYHPLYAGFVGAAQGGAAQLGGPQESLVPRYPRPSYSESPPIFPPGTFNRPGTDPFVPGFGPPPQNPFLPPPPLDPAAPPRLGFNPWANPAPATPGQEIAAAFRSFIPQTRWRIPLFGLLGGRVELELNASGQIQARWVAPNFTGQWRILTASEAARFEQNLERYPRNPHEWLRGLDLLLIELQRR